MSASENMYSRTNSMVRTTSQVIPYTFKRKEEIKKVNKREILYVKLFNEWRFYDLFFTIFTISGLICQMIIYEIEIALI